LSKFSVTIASTLFYETKARAPTIAGSVDQLSWQATASDRDAAPEIPCVQHRLDKPITTWQLAAFAVIATLVQMAIAAVWASPPAFRLVVAISQRAFGGSIADQHVFEDVRAYHEYASAPFSGQVPYRDILIEYPPAAYPIFLVPRLAAASLGAYRWAFAAEMALCALAINILNGISLSLTGQQRETSLRLAWYTLALAAMGPLPLARFDLAPTALALASFVAWQAARPATAGLLAALGMLTKLFPAVVLVPCFATETPPHSHARRRALAAFSLTLFAGVLAWFALGGLGAARSVTYHTERGLELTTVWSTLLIPFAWWTGASVSQVVDHHSVQLVAPGVEPVARLTPFVQLAALGLVAWRAARSKPDDLPRLAAAAVLAYAALGKVLSPQYMIWFLPFLPLIPGSTGRWARRLGLACAGLTCVMYPFASVAIVKLEPLAIGIVLIRNAALLALLGLLFVSPRDPAASPKRVG
jgi:hypothetical protein